MPRIIVQFGDEEWSVELREGVNVAGRSPQAAIPIRDASMSREHCEIVLKDAVATVVDRGSMNGTLVNGSKVDRKILIPGDKIQIGKASLFFEAKSGAPAKATAAPQSVIGIDDFSVWRKESGGMTRGLVAALALVVLAVGAVFLFKSIGGGTAVAADPGNLIGTAGRFEPGPDQSVPGWTMKPGLASRIQAVEGGAKQGKTCLQLEKSGAAGDLVAEVLCQEILAVPSSGRLEFSAWVRSDAANILPALKATWLAKRTGPVLLEEASEPAPGSSDWSRITQSFAPPPGATQVQISLVAIGRAGRILFDDVRARFESGAGSIASADLGKYSVVSSGAGVLGVAGPDGHPLMTNLQLFLASDKEGILPQVAATGTRVEVDASGRKLAVSGKLPSPVDLRPVEFEIEAREGKESLLLGYRLRGDALKLVDRLGIALLLPGGEVKGDYTNPVLRLWFRGASGDSILEISEGLMRVTADWVPEARRIVLGIPIPKGISEMAFGFQLKQGAGGQLDPIAEADKAIQEGRMRDAMDMLKDLLIATREPAKQQLIQARLKALEEAEAADWQAVQARRFMAELVGLKPHFEAALQKLDHYEKRWPAGKRAEAAKSERTALAAGLATAAEDRETLRAHRLLDRAEEHRKEGRGLLARELCETVRRHYAHTAAVARASELLQKLGSD